MKITIKLIIIALFLLTPFIIPGLVLAIDSPDSTPTIDNIAVNTYLLTEGDILIYGDYDIPYASLPPEAASESFIIRLMDEDGESELGSVTPYVLFDNGYNAGVFSFYFSTNTTVDWGSSYIIRISENPALFDSPESYDYTIGAGAWTSYTAQDDNQTELTINIINAAQRLEIVHTGYTLLEASAGGTILSNPTGEIYFRGAIYGIQAMSPDLFLVQTLTQDVTDRAWTTDQFNTYQERFADTWLGDDIDATASQFGLNATTVMALVVGLPLCIGGIILSAMKFRRTEPGIIFAAVVLIMCALMGWLPTAIFATIFQVLSVYLAYVLFYARG